MNSVDMIGRLTRDIDLRQTGTGVSVGTFTLAVNRDYTNQDGERKADFINCVIWRKAADNLAKFTNKGSQIGVHGKMQTRDYQAKEGHQVYVTELVVEKFYLIEPKNNNSENSYKNATSNDANSNSFYDPPNPFGGSPVDIDEDELPF